MNKPVMYDLAGGDPALRFSPHCWKTRMALAHKGLEPDLVPWRFTDREVIAFSGQGLVPVLVDGPHVVNDSWAIACDLDARYPDRPALFDGPQARALARFVNIWADTTLVAPAARLVLLDIYDVLDPKDRAYFRESREKRFGRSLEQVAADREGNLQAFREAWRPIRQTLAVQPFLSGEAPAYADYCAFGFLMWVRCVSPVTPLEADDPVLAWRERLLDLFGGLARTAPAVGP